jgi:hypothetical protein
MGILPVPNERVELEMQIMRYRQIASRTTDQEFLNKIAENRSSAK